MLLPMLNNTSTSSTRLNISLLRSCTIDCFAGAKIIKKVESEKREVKSEVWIARDLFYGIDEKFLSSEAVLFILLKGQKGS